MAVINHRSPAINGVLKKVGQAILVLQSLMCLDSITVLPLLSPSSIFFFKFPKSKYHPFSNTTKISVKNVQVSAFLPEYLCFTFTNADEALRLEEPRCTAE